MCAPFAVLVPDALAAVVPRESSETSAITVIATSPAAAVALAVWRTRRREILANVYRLRSGD
jgi:hypothetical protein